MGARSNRSGWAYGDRGMCGPGGTPSRWLTILGSAYERPVLYATQQEAEQALSEHPQRDNPRLDMVVAHVTEVPHSGVRGGYVYKITEPSGKERRPLT